MLLNAYFCACTNYQSCQHGLDSTFRWFVVHFFYFALFYYHIELFLCHSQRPGSRDVIRGIRVSLIRVPCLHGPPGVWRKSTWIRYNNIDAQLPGNPLKMSATAKVSDLKDARVPPALYWTEDDVAKWVEELGFPQYKVRWAADALGLSVSDVVLTQGALWPW